MTEEEPPEEPAVEPEEGDDPSDPVEDLREELQKPADGEERELTPEEREQLRRAAARIQEVLNPRIQSVLSDSLIVPAGVGEATPPVDPRLPLAVAAYLARFRGLSREHTVSDLRAFLRWCAERDIGPLGAQRQHLELHVRWMQETRRYKPSAVSRRTSVLAGFYRTCVIDGVLEHSPAEFVRRPTVPAELPTLGLTHLQFEAMLTAARESSNPNDFALVAMLGLLGPRIFEATGTDVGDLGEEHGHRVLLVVGKGSRVVLVPLPPAVGRAVDRAVDGRDSGPILRNTRGARMDRHAATRRLRHLATAAGARLPRMHPHMLRHTFVTTMLDAGVDLRDVQIAARHADPRTTMRYDRARKNLDRHPNYILAAYMALRHLSRLAGRTYVPVVPMSEPQAAECDLRGYEDLRPLVDANPVVQTSNQGSPKEAGHAEQSGVC